MADVIGGLSSAAQNLNPGSISGVINSVSFAPVFFFMKVFFSFALLILGAIAFYKFYLVYNKLVTVKSRLSGGGLEIKQDKAKIVVDAQGKTKLQLYKLKNGKQRLTCPLPERKFLAKIGKKDHYELWLDDNWQLHPIPGPTVIVRDGDQEGEVPPEVIPSLHVRPQERDAWARYESKLLDDKYKKDDKWKELLPYAALAVTCITAFLIFFFGFQYLGNGLASLSTQFAQVASSCTVMH